MPTDDEPTEEPTARDRARRRDRPLVQRAIVSDALMDPEERERIGFDPDPAAPMPVVVELNLRHRDGLEGAAAQFERHFEATLGGRPAPERVADTYFRCELTQAEILRLVEADQLQPDAAERAIYRVWPDFPVRPLIDISCATVKADAARRSFDATGRGHHLGGPGPWGPRAGPGRRPARPPAGCCPGAGGPAVPRR